MGYRYVEVHQFEPEDFASELCGALDRLRREDGAEVVGVSMSTAIDTKPGDTDTPVIRRIAQVLLWHPDTGPVREPGTIIGI